MLKALRIRNLALIESLELTLSSGFTALTGETGAGKSILLDALALALGGRADASLVRHGAERADVQAQFYITALPTIRTWLADNDLLDEDEPESLLLRRVVRSGGGSSAWINGVKVPAAQLRALGEQLVDIHGQHAQQLLLKSDHQRALLDAFAGHDNLLTRVADAHRHWRDLKRELEEKRSLKAEQAEQLELIAFKLKELDALAPSAEEYETLNRQHNQLAHAETLLADSRQAETALDGEAGAAHQLACALDALERLAGIDESVKPLADQLNELLIGVEELARDLTHYARNIELDPQQLAEVEARLGEYHRLARKFLVDPQALESLHAELRVRHDALTNVDADLDALEDEVSEARQRLEVLAAELHDSRAKAGERLAEAVQVQVRRLDLPHAEFSVSLEEKPLDATGIDTVTFLLTTNPGLPAAPLHKVASGGELSRISLALEVVLADVAGVPTLIFDEVDVGIGGGVAEQVGRLMRQLGEHRQVLAVTHQPQVAACAHHHLQVSKTQQDEQTTTTVTRLDEAARIEELARMLGGATLTEATFEHAREMLTLSQKQGVPPKNRRS